MHGTFAGECSNWRFLPCFEPKLPSSLPVMRSVVRILIETEARQAPCEPSFTCLRVSLRETKCSPSLPPSFFVRYIHSCECSDYWVSWRVSSGWWLVENWGQSFWLVDLCTDCVRGCSLKWPLGKGRNYFILVGVGVRDYYLYFAFLSGLCPQIAFACKDAKWYVVGDFIFNSSRKGVREGVFGAACVSCVQNRVQEVGVEWFH